MSKSRRNKIGRQVHPRRLDESQMETLERKSLSHAARPKSNPRNPSFVSSISGLEGSFFDSEFLLREDLVQEESPVPYVIGGGVHLTVYSAVFHNPGKKKLILISPQGSLETNLGGDVLTLHNPASMEPCDFMVLNAYSLAKDKVFMAEQVSGYQNLFGQARTPRDSGRLKPTWSCIHNRSNSFGVLRDDAFRPLGLDPATFNCLDAAACGKVFSRPASFALNKNAHDGSESPDLRITMPLFERRTMHVDRLIYDQFVSHLSSGASPVCMNFSTVMEELVFSQSEGKAPGVGIITPRWANLFTGIYALTESDNQAMMRIAYLKKWFPVEPEHGIS